MTLTGMVEKEKRIEFQNMEAQLLSDLWRSQRDNLSIEQKNDIGYAYLKHIIGADESTIESFIADSNFKSDEFIGLRQGGAKPRREDYESYWNEINRITPGVYTEENLSFLIKEGGIMSVCHMLFQIEDILNEQSSVMRNININAHTYK